MHRWRERARDVERASEDMQRGKGRAAPDTGKILPVVTQKRSLIEKWRSVCFYFLAEHLRRVIRFLDGVNPDVKFKRKTFNCSDRAARMRFPPCATGHC